MVYESMGETFGTKEGWKELGTAALITLIGGGATGNLFGDAKGIDERRKFVQESVAGYNTFGGDILAKRLAMSNQIQGAQEREDKADSENNLVAAEVARNDKMFSRLNFNRAIERDPKEDIEELQLSLANMTAEDFEQAGIEAESIDEF